MGIRRRQNQSSCFQVFVVEGVHLSPIAATMAHVPSADDRSVDQKGASGEDGRGTTPGP